MSEKGSRTPLTWAPGKKPGAMQNWLLNVASDENISCGALRTAVVLPPLTPERPTPQLLKHHAAAPGRTDRM